MLTADFVCGLRALLGVCELSAQAGLGYGGLQVTMRCLQTLATLHCMCWQLSRRLKVGMAYQGSHDCCLGYTVTPHDHHPAQQESSRVLGPSCTLLRIPGCVLIACALCASAQRGTKHFLGGRAGRGAELCMSIQV
jgi:hypothetical protein